MLVFAPEANHKMTVLCKVQSGVRNEITIFASIMLKTPKIISIPDMTNCPKQWNIYKQDWMSLITQLCKYKKQSSIHFKLGELYGL